MEDAPNLAWCDLLLTTRPFHRSSIAQSTLLKKFGTRLLYKPSSCAVFGEAAASTLRTLKTLGYKVVSIGNEVSQDMKRKDMVSQFTAMCNLLKPPVISQEDFSALRLGIRLDALLPLTD
jgi:hypothetical protein